MKKIALLLALLLIQLPLCGMAQVNRIGGPSELPEGWEDRDLLRLTVVDTDRSDAMILQCGGETMLIDGGEWYYFKNLCKELEACGVTEIKYLYNTHSDGDHVQGLISLIRSDLYPIGTYLSANSADFHDSKGYHQMAVKEVRNSKGTKKKRIRYKQIFDGDVLTLGKGGNPAALTVIHCDEPWDTNNRSAACQVRFGDSRLLLLGDCGNQALRYFLENRDHDLLKCDVMKIMHHGVNGVVPEFLNVALPQFVFVTNTSGNLMQMGRYEEYMSMGAMMSGDGTLVLETDGVTWYVWQK